MSFMESYKSLDKLCKTFPDYPKGISSYIEVMEQCLQKRYQCKSWYSDYEKLKKYRHIRNRISHDSGVYEEDVTCFGDEFWLQDFHSRILDRSDPVCFYYKLKQTAEKPKLKTDSSKSERNSAAKLWIYASLLLAAAAVILASAFIVWVLTQAEPFRFF